MTIKRLIKFSISIGMSIGLIPLVICLTLGIPEVANAAGPWYVQTDGDDSNSCLSPGPSNACATIQAAVDKAVSGDVVYVAGGTFFGSGDWAFVIDKDISISGGWNETFTSQDQTTILDGQGLSGVLFISEAINVLIEHIVIQGGNSEGGLYNHGDLVLNNSTVQQNSGTGITNVGIIHINKCKIQDNIVDSVTGGISNIGIAVINESAILNNVALSGGGIASDDNLFINNSTISRNTSSSGGGGGISSMGLVQISSSTITENHANAGGGIAQSGGTIIMKNTILASNSASEGSDCHATIQSDGYNLVGNTDNCTITPVTGDLIGVEPYLGVIIEQTEQPAYYPLLSVSQAIDAGDPAGCSNHEGVILTSDQRGALRSGRCDIGAYEYTTPTTPTSIYAYKGSPQRTPPNTTFRIPFEVLVLDNIGSPVIDVSVTFTAPISDASGTFADTGTNEASATTNESGIADASHFTANGIYGSYTVSGNVPGVAPPAPFLISNEGWYVAPGGDDSNNCSTPASPCGSINGALSKTTFTSGDTVLVASGTYTDTSDEVVFINTSVRLSGGWDENFSTHNEMSIIDGEDTRRGITIDVDAEDVTVDHFTIQNGYGTAPYCHGGGVRIAGGAVTISNSLIQNNYAPNGGGICVIDGFLTLTHSILQNNQANVNGGGLYIDSGTAILEDAIVRGNSTQSEQLDSDGGGIENRGNLTLRRTSVINNIGRGVTTSNSSGFTLIEDSAILNNLGGGIIVWGTTHINNSTISENESPTFGGGIYFAGESITVSSSTIANNSAFAGGGIYKYGTAATIRNSIIAGNEAGEGPDCLFTISSDGYNLVEDLTDCEFIPTTGDQTGKDPGLGALLTLQDTPGYMRLVPGSPAIDGGDPAGCRDHAGDLLDTDQRGAPRTGICDIGAYEYTTPGAASKLVMIGGSPQTTPPGFPFWYPFQTAVLDDIGTPVSGISVTYTAPQDGASGTFTDTDSYTTTQPSDSGGIAASPIFIANTIEASYHVTATANSDITPVLYSLKNGGWYVANNGDDGNDCQTKITPCATIPGALNKEVFYSGDPILVASGVYSGTGDQVVLMDIDTRLFGGWDDGFTNQNDISIIDGENERRVFKINQGVTALLDRLLIQYGGGGEGLGIFNEGTLVVQNSEVSYNQGSIVNQHNLTIDNSMVQFNQRIGIINSDFRSKLIINNSSISNNTVDSGAAGITNDGTLYVNHSDITNNSAESCSSYGGISNNQNGIATISHSTVSGNFACNGALYNTNVMSVTHSTIYGNEGLETSGGIENSGSLSLVNSTVSHNIGRNGIDSGSGTLSIQNSTITNHDGVGVNSNYYDDSLVSVTNSIIEGNTTDCRGQLISGGYNLIGDTTNCTITATEGDLFDLEAGLNSLQDNGGPTPTHALLPGSPAIDAGSCPDESTDQRGLPRPVDITTVSNIDDACDIGAFEVQIIPPTISGTQAGQTVDDNDTIDPFSTVTIEDQNGDDLTVSVSLDNIDKGSLTNLGGFVEGPPGTYTFIGSPTDSSAAIQGLSFVPTPDRVPIGQTETTTFTISADDGIAAPVIDDNTTVIVTAVGPDNTPPSISGTRSGQKVNDNATIKPFTTVTISDPDEDASLVVKIKVEDDNTGELTNLGGFVKVDDDTYKFTGSPPAATSAIRNLIFVPNENRLKPGDTEKTTFIIRADDGIADPVVDKDTTVIVTSINDKPTISGTVAGQTVDDNDSIKPFSKVVIADPDKKASLTVIVKMDDDHKGELRNLNGFVEGPDGTYTFLGNSTTATSAIQGLKFVPKENRLKPGDKETAAFTITVDDGIADPVLDDTTTVIVTSINDAPTISGTQAGQVVGEGATIDPFAGVSIIDPDKMATLTVVLSMDNPDTGELTNLGGFVEGPHGTYTFTGSPQESTIAIQGLTFIPTEGRVPPGQSETTTFTISADDGIADPVVDDKTSVIVRVVAMTERLFMPLIMR